ncbi:hypothetical protein E4U41_000299 [Claviceps citrina]|nr:hypothetical protein E4U41_000299 [Claviceps citrina]
MPLKPHMNVIGSQFQGNWVPASCSPEKALEPLEPGLEWAGENDNSGGFKMPQHNARSRVSQTQLHARDTRRGVFVTDSSTLSNSLTGEKRGGRQKPPSDPPAIPYSGPSSTDGERARFACQHSVVSHLDSRHTSHKFQAPLVGHGGAGRANGP